MQNFFDKEQADRMGKVLLTLVVVVALYFGMKFVNEIKTFHSIGMEPTTAATIDVTGTGSTFAVPDVATINFSVEAQGKTVEVAQGLVTTRINQAMDFLKTSNVDTKDIQTTSYSAYPQYNDPCNGQVPCMNAESTQHIVAYIVSESVTVKIRNTDDSGKIIDGLGAAGITGITGPEFSVDQPDAIQAQSRQKAIDDAQAKAKVLADQLGVHLGKIVRFSVDNGSTPGPIMYDAKSMMATGAAAAPTTNIAAGQNKFDSNVTITYEIY